MSTISSLNFFNNINIIQKSVNENNDSITINHNRKILFIQNVQHLIYRRRPLLTQNSKLRQSKLSAI